MKRSFLHFLSRIQVRLGIQGKILISFTFAVSLSFFILSSLLYTNYEKIIRSNVLAHNETMAINLSDDISDFINKINQFYYSLYSNNLIQTIAQMEQMNFDSVRYCLSFTNTTDHLISFYGLDNIVDSVLIVNQNGEMLFQNGYYKTPEYALEKPTFTIPHDNTISNWVSAPYYSPISGSLNRYNGQHISFSYLVEDYKTNNDHYYVLLMVRLDAIQNKIDSLTNDFQNICLLTTDGQIICRSGNNDIPIHDLLTLIDELSTAESISTNINSEPVFLSSYPIHITDWRLFFYTYEKGLFHDAAALKSYTLLLTFSILGLAVIISFVLSHRLVVPIRRLKAKTLEVMKGNLDIRIPIVSRDEIGELGKCMDKMLVRIQTLMTEKYEAKLCEKEAQLFALNAQINPHFLYNTLDTISSIAIDKGVEDISEIAISMAAMYRYSIRLTNQATTLGDEVDHVKHYLKILKVRYEDRLHAAYSFTEEAMKCNVLQLILQPLVENAVYHGIEPKRGGGEILLSGFCKSGYLHLIIEDNGVGMSEEQLGKILDNLANRNLSDRDHIGLRNVYERLRLHFGDEIIFHLSSTRNQGTKIEILLPACFKSN